MIIKYEIDISNDVIRKDLDRITNQIFKLLPGREEGEDWETPLQNLIIEIGGMASLFFDQVDLLRLLCKMEGLKTLKDDSQFFLFRTTIFECLSILTKVKKCLD